MLINKGEQKIISKKFHLPNNSLFDEKRYFNKSDSRNLVEIKGIKIGFPICEDIWFSDISKVLKKPLLQRKWHREPEFMDILENYLRPDDIFFDLGCNIGYVSLRKICKDSAT